MFLQKLTQKKIFVQLFHKQANYVLSLASVLTKLFKIMDGVFKYMNGFFKGLTGLIMTVLGLGVAVEIDAIFELNIN